MDKAGELGMPCVMLLNLGSQGGPTDRSSELCQMIDSYVGAAIPGLAFVTGTGDDGGNPNRAGNIISQVQVDTLRVHKDSAGSLILDLWYGGGDRFDVIIQTPTGSYGPYPSPATNNDFTFDQNSEFVFYHLGSAVAFYNPANGKREIWLRIDGLPGDYRLVLSGATVINGQYDATLNPSQSWNAAYQNNIFQNHAAPGSIWDGATAFDNIAPNSYVIRNSWIDIDGIPR